MMSTEMYTIGDFEDIITANGYGDELPSYVDPAFLVRCCKRELGTKLSLEEYTNSLDSLKVELTPDEIVDYLDDLFAKEEPDIKKYMDKVGYPIKPLDKWTPEQFEQLQSDFNAMESIMVANSYRFRKEFYDAYVSRIESLKVKMRYIVSFINLLEQNKKGDLPPDSKFDKLQSVFEVEINKNGDIASNDFCTIVALLVNCSNELKEVTQKANTPRTYYLYNKDRLYKLSIDRDPILRGMKKVEESEDTQKTK